MVRIGNATGKAGTRDPAASAAETVGSGLGRARAAGRKSKWTWRDVKLWDEFAPELHELTVGSGDDERSVRFGMREFAAARHAVHDQRPADLPARHAGVLRSSR